MSKDTIYRQDAIDALAEHEKSKGHNYTMFVDVVSECAEIIRDLPSAQPEIIYCRECKFASGDSRICMKSGYSPIGELDFCAWAEQKDEIACEDCKYWFDNGHWPRYCTVHDKRPGERCKDARRAE